MLFLDVNENEMDNVERLQEMIDKKKNVFVLVYMIGCTPCKQTLPEWNKLKICKELKQYENNDDIIVANVEQSMCEKMHHTELENIMSFPTIKHIKHNDVHNYNNERSTSAFSKWIKGLIKDDSKLKDINEITVINQNKTNHGNIDMLIKSNRTTNRSKSKANQKKSVKKKTIKRINKSIKTKRINKSKKHRSKPRKIKRINKSIKTKRINKSKKRRSKSRKIFQKPLNYS
jgi:hypothetical protein